MSGRIIAIVGMPGCGKTLASEFFIKRDFQFLRFGQLTLDEIKKQKLKPTEENEKRIREAIRKKHGMGAFAKLNLPRINELLQNGDVVVDGLYSWSEYVILKEKYGESLFIIAIYSSPKTRYERLTKRKLEKDDVYMKNRPMTLEDAKKRDYAEIENIEKGGPIAMADYTIINELSSDELKEHLKTVLDYLKKG